MALELGTPDVVQSLTVETQVSPPVTVALHGTPTTGGAPDWLLGLLKPRFTFDTAFGPFIYQPGGEPDTRFASLGVGLLAAIGVFALIGFLSLFRK